MNLNLSISRVLVTAFAVTVSLAWVADLRADAESVEIRELKAVLAMTQQQLAEARADAATAEQRRKELINSLAESVRVSEEQVARARETELQLQAFGVDLLAQGENGLEQRLLKAVRDLDISQQELEMLKSELHRLSESFLNYLAASADAPEAARAEASAAIASSGEILAGVASDGESGSLARGLSDSQVVSIEPEIGLIVLDAGRRAGLRVGTPISVLKGDQPIYSAMIIDVRDSISGAVLQDQFSETATVAVGDGVKLLPNQTNL
ncbi:MAG: hypothetical protein P1U68_14780 [Verrucomicrobiales bacterium]|nr:hypothetical protein [Verrucomicrobiales bacterium]MDF1825908.1 hypothetical protein [Verrucomicrobiales bacterium]